MLYIALAMHSKHASSSQLLKLFEVDSSHMTMSSEVKSSRIWYFVSIHFCVALLLLCTFVAFINKIIVNYKKKSMVVNLASF